MTEISWKKNTALFIGGQAITLVGSMVVQFAIFWHITLETKSGTMMTVFTVVGMLPMFFISPFGGVWADRYNRKLVINLADGIIAFASLIVAVLLMFGYTHYGILLTCAAIRSLGQGVQMPAAGAVIPQIVPSAHLTRVNGIQGSVQSFCMLASPMLGGALMTFMPLESMFFLDVATAAVGISVLQFFVKVPDVKKAARAGVAVNEIEPAADAAQTVDPAIHENAGKSGSFGYFDDLKEGLRYIRGHGFVFRLIVLSAAFHVLIAPLAFLTPLQVARHFGDEVWRLTAIEIAFSSGMIAGGALIATWGGFKNRTLTIAFSYLLTGINAVLLGVTPVFWAYLGLMALAGVTVPLSETPMRVMLQSKVAPEYMGRVLSVFTMAASSMMPLAMLAFGPIADIVSINTILILTGAATALFSLSFVTSKTLLRAGVPVPSTIEISEKGSKNGTCRAQNAGSAKVPN